MATENPLVTVVARDEGNCCRRLKRQDEEGQVHKGEVLRHCEEGREQTREGDLQGRTRELEEEGEETIVV